VAIDAAGKRQKQADERSAAAPQRRASSSSSAAAPKMSSGGNAAAFEALFTLSYADLFDDARFALASEGVPSSVEFCPTRLPGDAEVIAVGRVGRVFRKQVRGVDTVVKVLALCDKRDELDGLKDVVPLKIADELRREEAAYVKLAPLQGRCVPRFLGLGQALGGAVHLFATEYAGEPLREPVSRDVKAQMQAALRAVHELGVSHGDVAAKNFVRRGDGRVIVLDFGLCVFKDEVDQAEWERLVAADMAALEDVEAVAPVRKRAGRGAVKRRFEESGSQAVE